MRRDDTPRLQKLKSTNSKREIRDTETKGRKKKQNSYEKTKIKGKKCKVERCQGKEGNKTQKEVVKETRGERK